MKKNLLLLSVLGLSLAACNDASNTNTDDTTTQKDSTAAAKEITLTPTDKGPEFPNATLGIKSMKGTPIDGTDSVQVEVVYEVANYELKAQTADAANRTCNNSKDGQHIHFILDNEPYAALYEPTHTFKVAKKSSHTILSFLSRSYHLSLKNKEAMQLVKIDVDDKGNVKMSEAPKTPMVFYSRPKGDYLGKDANDILLDFYVVNASLAADKYKVVATVNNKTFTIDQWQPYLIQHLPMGTNNIQLQLVDSSNNAVSGDFTAVSREFKLASN